MSVALLPYGECDGKSFPLEDNEVSLAFAIRWLEEELPGVPHERIIIYVEKCRLGDGSCKAVHLLAKEATQ